jgi:hypothetical protein
VNLEDSLLGVDLEVVDQEVVNQEVVNLVVINLEMLDLEPANTEVVDMEVVHLEVVNLEMDKLEVINLEYCEQRFWAGSSGPGPGPNRTAAKLVVRVVNKPERSTQVQFNGKLPTHLNLVGCQQVTQWVHL